MFYQIVKNLQKFLIYLLKKKAVYKWTCMVQIYIVQMSTAISEALYTFVSLLNL